MYATSRNGSHLSGATRRGDDAKASGHDFKGHGGPKRFLFTWDRVHLHAYATVSEAKAKLCIYLDFYNGRPPHTALDRQTADTAYFIRQPVAAAA
jgi:hypothetical protein